MVEQESSRREPPSRRIARELRGAIVAEEFLPGAKLPSERDLAMRYGTARNTAREAIRILTDEGLVTTEHGRGAFVRRKVRLLRFGADRYSHHLRASTGLSPYRAEVAKQGRTARVDCVSIEKELPPAAIAERLGVDAGTRSIVRRENWYYADDEPVQVGNTYIPWTIAGGSVLATSANMGKGSLYARFADLGHDITRNREEVVSRMPSPDEAEGLSIPEGVPVLVVTHTSINQHGDPFEVTTFTMRADLTGLDYTMAVED